MILTYNSKGFVSVCGVHIGMTKNEARGIYICTGLNAKKYHSSPECRWLENCSGEIKEITIEEAQRQGKTPWKGCH